MFRAGLVVTALMLPAVGGALGAATASADAASLPAAPASAHSAPTAPPVTWCETGFNSQNPYTKAPAGAVVVPAGDDSTQPFMQSWTTQPNTTYWFAPGTHTFGTSQYASIDVANGDVFLGAPGAILSGQGHNDYAFTAHSSAPMTTPQNATIEYLTIENYMAGDGEMVVGQGGYDGWTIEYNTVKDNPQGAGIGLSTNGTVENNCTEENGEYGFSSLGGSTGIKFEYNDVYDNNNAGYYDIPGSTVQCGCSGGGKFWMTKNSAIDYNYVHGNIGTAIWADTDNAGLDISGNYITDNWSNAIAYEISYNGNITDNYLAGNDYGDVTTNDSPSFPAGAIFLNGSGDSTAVRSKYNGGTMYISGNVLVNNWGEITLFQDSNRVCGFSADGICTRPFGSPFHLSSCYAHLNGKTQAQAEAREPQLLRRLRVAHAKRDRVRQQDQLRSVQAVYRTVCGQRRHLCVGEQQR